MSDDARESPPEVGSLGDEAAKLFGALSTWARDQQGDLGEGLSGSAERAGEAWADLNEHLATGAPECTVCPICRVVHAVRETSPEVRAHLTTAAAALLQAAAGVLATAAPDESRAAAARGAGVEHIDVENDWPAGDHP